MTAGSTEGTILREKAGELAALFVSFSVRAGQSGGAIASRGFETVVRRAFGDSLQSVYHDDAERVCEVGGVALRVSRRSTASMAARLLLTGDIGRIKIARLSGRRQPPSQVRRVLVVDGAGHASFLRRLRRSFRPIVMIHQNFEPDYYADHYAGRWQKWWMVRAGRRAEALSARYADQHFFVTVEDLERFTGEFPSLSASCHVLGVQEEWEPPVPPPRQAAQELRVLITAAMTDRKGVLGLVDFLHTVLLRREELRSRLRIVIVGRGTPESVRTLCDDALVELHENVPDIGPIARTCDVYANPNYTGSGIKMRNLDGLRHGLPVVCRIENSNGFREMAPIAFQTVVDSSDCLARLLSFDPQKVRTESQRLAVWDEYRRHFSLDVGVERFRRGLSLPS